MVFLCNTILWWCSYATPSYDGVPMQHHPMMMFLCNTILWWCSYATPSYDGLPMQHHPMMLFLCNTILWWSSNATPSYDGVPMQHHPMMVFLCNTLLWWASNATPSLEPSLEHDGVGSQPLINNMSLINFSRQENKYNEKYERSLRHSSIRQGSPLN